MSALRLTRILAIVPVLVSMLAWLTPHSAWSRFSKTRPKKAPYVEGELIVKYRSELSHSRHLQSISRHGGIFVAHVGEPSTLHVRLPWGRTVADSIGAYNNDPDVEFAQPNYIYRLMTVPNTTDYAAGNLWGFHNTGQTISPAVGQFLQPMDAPDANNNPPPVAASYYDMDMPAAWAITSDCRNVITAVIDSGLNYNHTDLSGNLWNGVGGANCPGPGGVGSGGAPTAHGGCDIVNGTNNPIDQFGHGTHVAGTIAAAGSTVTLHGHTGVCWQAKLMPLRVFDQLGNGGTTATITRAINYAVANGAKVINMSLGGEAFDNTQFNALTNAKSHGVVVVIAAGNNSSDNDLFPFYPCNFGAFGLSNILCVAAVDQASQLSSFSNFGTNSVNVAAPGSNIMSTWPGTNTVFPAAAGDPMTTADTFGNAWNFNAAFSTGSSGAGWATNTINLSLGLTPELCEPFGFPAVYGASANDVAWKVFSGEMTTGASITTTLGFQAFFSLSQTDSVSLYIDNSGSDPSPGDFGSGTLLDSYSGSNSVDGSYTAESYNATPYANANTDLAFELISGPSGGSGAGISIIDLTFNQLNISQNSQYNVIEGTSMATPHVAGLAALLYSFNPLFTYTDVVTAITKGGTSLASVHFQTISGKAVNAFNSLTYIAQPTGVTATTP